MFSNLDHVSITYPPTDTATAVQGCKDSSCDATTLKSLIFLPSTHLSNASCTILTLSSENNKLAPLSSANACSSLLLTTICTSVGMFALHRSTKSSIHTMFPSCLSKATFTFSIDL